MPKDTSRIQDDLRAGILLEVFNFARRCLRELVPDFAIDDVAQEATIAMNERLDAEPECVHNRRKLFGYVMGITQHKAADYHRADGSGMERDHTHADGQSRYTPDWMSSDVDVFNEEATVIANTAIRLLPEPLRSTFLVITENDLTFVDAAKVLGINVNTASRRFNAALTFLSAHLMGYVHDGRDNITRPSLPPTQPDKESAREAKP